jgi:hypothetical protein
MVAIGNGRLFFGSPTPATRRQSMLDCRVEVDRIGALAGRQETKGFLDRGENRTRMRFSRDSMLRPGNGDHA